VLLGGERQLANQFVRALLSVHLDDDHVERARGRRHHDDARE
jgi:hypothetical protein